MVYFTAVGRCSQHALGGSCYLEIYGETVRGHFTRAILAAIHVADLRNGLMLYCP